MSGKPYKIDPEIDAIIRSAGARADAAGAVELAQMANRIVSELHKVARKIANEKRGTPEWGPLGKPGQHVARRGPEDCRLPQSRKPTRSRGATAGG